MEARQILERTVGLLGRSSVKFYRELAARAASEEIRRTLESLARRELEHSRELLRLASDPDSSSPFVRALQRIDGILKLVLHRLHDAQKQLDMGVATPKQALKLALKLERDSLLVFLHLYGTDGRVVIQGGIDLTVCFIKLDGLLKGGQTGLIILGLVCICGFDLVIPCRFVLRINRSNTDNQY